MDDIMKQTQPVWVEVVPTEPHSHVAHIWNDEKRCYELGLVYHVPVCLN